MSGFRKSGHILAYVYELLLKIHLMISRIGGIHAEVEQTKYQDVQMVYHKTYTTCQNSMVWYSSDCDGSLHYHNHVCIQELDLIK